MTKRSYIVKMNVEEILNATRGKLLIGDLKENCENLEKPVMGGEDFSYFGYKIPSAYAFLGIAQEGKEVPYHHHPKFYFRSEIVAESAKLLSQIAFDAIEELNK